MFKNVQPKTTLQSVFSTLELIYHEIVMGVRQQHGNAIIAIGMNMLMAVIMVMAFYAFFSVLGLRAAKLRGDFLLYIMSGIFMFMNHTQVVNAIIGAANPTSPMLLHTPLNPLVTILAAAFRALYMNTLTLFVILYCYHTIFNRISIDDPIPAYGMMLIAWVSGVAVGLVFAGIQPWAPNLVKTLSTVYLRVTMIASGKMFVANALPNKMLALFDWHPLFHCVDQARGFIFENYFPRNSDWVYPLKLSVALIVIGMMGEFFTRQRASASWGARR